jgi:imidazolonepropionase-like amidohydrolase
MVTSSRSIRQNVRTAGLRGFENQPAVDPTHLILLKGGTIISMDPKVGDLVRGDLLNRRQEVAAIAPELNPAGAQVIDAQDTIIVPGFVDCHRHSWEAQLRRINPNSPTLADYSNATHLSFAKAYRPQDCGANIWQAPAIDPDLGLVYFSRGHRELPCSRAAMLQPRTRRGEVEDRG